MIIPYIENSNVRQPYVWERNFPDLPHDQCLTIINVDYDNILNVITNIIEENKDNRFLSVQYANQKLYIYTKNPITTNGIPSESVTKYRPQSKPEIIEKLENLKNSVNFDADSISLYVFYTLIGDMNKSFESICFSKYIMLDGIDFSYNDKKINSKDIYDSNVLLIPQDNSYIVMNYYACKVDVYIYPFFHFSIDEDGIQNLHFSDKDLKDLWINNDLAKKIYFKIDCFPEFLQSHLRNIRENELNNIHESIKENSKLIRKLTRY